MFCPYCGAKVGDDFVFCAKCGRRLPSFEFDTVAEKSTVGSATREMAEEKGDNNPDEQFRRFARLPSLESDAVAEKPMGNTMPREAAEEKVDNYLDKQFRRIIAKMPGEALSHFKVVDSVTWRVAMVGTAEARRIATLGWCGPYTIKVCGKKYVAYADKVRLPASQVRFLHEWAGGCKKALKMKLRALNDDSGDAARRMIALFVSGIVIVGCALAVYLISVKWGGTFR